MKKQSKIAAIAAAPLALFAVASNAAIPTVASDAFTTLQTDSLGFIDLAWPVIAIVTTGFVGIRLFKRGAGQI